MKYYYEKSSILDSEINITYDKLFHKNDDELDEWIEEVRQYVMKEWDEKGIPPLVGQSIEDIIKSFKKLREYNIRGFIEKADDGKRNVIKNFNKFANGINQFFPTMLKTRIGDMGNGLNSIYDRINFSNAYHCRCCHTSLSSTTRHGSNYIIRSHFFVCIG